MMKTTKKPKTSSTSISTIKSDSAKASTVKAETIKTSPVKASSTNGPKAASKPETKTNHVLLELVKPGAKSVCVAGSFNQWTPETTPLVRKGDDHWVGDLTVKPGRHEYLFVVDGQWMPDPNAKESVANPFGGCNSVLIVSE